MPSTRRGGRRCCATCCDLRWRRSGWSSAHEKSSYTLDGIERATYLACNDAPIAVEWLAESVTAKLGCTASQVAEAVEMLDDRRLIWPDGDRVLGVAVPRAVAEERLASQWRHQWTSIYR